NWALFGTDAESAAGQRRNACPASPDRRVDRPEADYPARAGQLFQMPGALRHFFSPGARLGRALSAAVDLSARAWLAPEGLWRHRRADQGSHKPRPAAMRPCLDPDVFAA